MKNIENSFLVSNIYSSVGKSSQLNVRVKDDLKSDLEKIAEYHGLTVSSYVHSLLTKDVREARQSMPELFGRPDEHHHVAPIVATITPAEVSPEVQEAENIRRQLQGGVPVSPSSSQTMPAELGGKRTKNTEHKRKTR